MKRLPVKRDSAPLPFCPPLPGDVEDTSRARRDQRPRTLRRFDALTARFVIPRCAAASAGGREAQGGLVWAIYSCVHGPWRLLVATSPAADKRTATAEASGGGGPAPEELVHPCCRQHGHGLPTICSWVCGTAKIRYTKRTCENNVTQVLCHQNADTYSKGHTGLAR